MKKKTFREIQLKYNDKYISQYKTGDLPKPVRWIKAPLSILNSLEVLLHPLKPRWNEY